MASNEVEILDPAASVESLKKKVTGPGLNRRNFMTALGMTGSVAGAALLSSRSGNRPKSVSAVGPAPQDVFNFFLNLKYLQATFYSYVTQGKDLPASLTAGGTSTTTGGQSVTGQPTAAVAFTGSNAAQITDLLNEIYYDELNTLTDLHNIQGTYAVVRPAINLSAATTPPFGTATIVPIPVNATTALGVARLIEDTCASAFAGMSSFLSGSNLTFAAQMMATDGFHAAALRLVSIQNPTIAAYRPTEHVVFVGVLLSGNATITAVSSTAGLVVGQLISGTGVAAGATITAIGTGTVTMSAVATASTAAANTTNFTTVIPSDPLDVQPADPGSAVIAAAGPSVVAGSIPTLYQGFFNTAGAGSATSINPAGMAFARNLTQTLSVLYATYGLVPNPGAGSGGFFPIGMTGLLTAMGSVYG